MPPNPKLNKADIINAAVELVRSAGIEAINARALAERLSCSTQPIFSNFSSMESLKWEVLVKAYSEYVAFTERQISTQAYPPYKATGMAYILFAKNEPQLFKLLFMRDRRGEAASADIFTSERVIPMAMKNLGISRADAERFHVQMWAFVHGIATMFATSFASLELNEISDMITDIYQGVGALYKERNKDLNEDDRN